MKMENDRFVVYGNAIEKSHSQKAIQWQNMFVKKFNYDPDEKYVLHLEDNPYLGPLFGLKNIVRGEGRRAGAERECRDLQHHPHGLRALPHRHGGRLLRPGNGLHALLAGSARHPGHHHRCDQPLQPQLQLLLAPFAA